MLRFIIISTARRETDLNFNTSHVTVYLNNTALRNPLYPNFNTSHVTVYLYKIINFEKGSKFQYISCYGLSIVYNLEYQKKKDFNTSHVTVYHDPSSQVAYNVLIFQYISCYGLSIFNRSLLSHHV